MPFGYDTSYADALGARTEITLQNLNSDETVDSYVAAKRCLAAKRFRWMDNLCGALFNMSRDVG